MACSAGEARRAIREDRMFKHTAALFAFSAILWSPAQAEMNGATRIGVLNDMSSVYSDFQGPGSVVAAQMSAEQFAKASNRKVEILSADHQNKPDIAPDKNKVFIGSGAGTALLTGAKCSPNTVHWTYDTWAMGHGVARGLLQ